MPTRSEQPVLFRQIAAYVEEGITTGKFQSGEPLPSDMQLARKFKTSRPTVVRAMIDLEHRGLVERRAGSGTYMKRSEVAEDGAGMKLGLLAAGLDGTEILNPLCDEVCRHAERLVALEMDFDKMQSKDPGKTDTLRVQKLIKYMKDRPDHKASFATLRGVLQVDAPKLRAVIKAADKLDPGRFEVRDDEHDKRKSWLFAKR